MLVKLIPGLEKYAMDSSNVTLLLLVVLATIVIKDIFEQKIIQNPRNMKLMGLYRIKQLRM